MNRSQKSDMDRIECGVSDAEPSCPPSPVRFTIPFCCSPSCAAHRLVLLAILSASCFMHRWLTILFGSASHPVLTLLTVHPFHCPILLAVVALLLLTVPFCSTRVSSTVWFCIASYFNHWPAAQPPVHSPIQRPIPLDVPSTIRITIPSPVLWNVQPL